MSGRHTNIIIDELQRATDAVERGECYYVVVSLPPRHGKSDLCSRRYPVWNLLKNPNTEIILTSYSGELACDMSYSARACMVENADFYGVRIAEGRGRIGSWGLDIGDGGINSVGLGGTITGRGANHLIVDDYCKGRQEAESETMRNKVWDSFRSDLLTRLAPNHSVIILATRWHEDDLIGRIKKEMKKSTGFPKFKIINMQAYNEATKKYLFPERFPPEWYERQRAAIGEYAWQCLYQNDPQPRRGNMFKVDNIKIVDNLPPGLRFVRGWDLASSEKQRMKDDPDFTVGIKSSFDPDNRIMYIEDMKRLQAEAPERDKAILETAKNDGSSVLQRLEVVAGYKDTFTRMKAALMGLSLVEGVTPDKDKVARASLLEPIIEAGNFVLKKGAWNGDLINEFRGFPSGQHDDIVDSVVISGGKDLIGEYGGVVVSDDFGF